MVVEEKALLLMLTFDETEICFNEQHPLKEPFSIETKDDGNETCFNERHPLKVPSATVVSDDGNLICTNEMHL